MIDTQRLTTLILTQKNLTRLLVGIIIILSLAAGYFHAAVASERNKYLKLEDKYVRVRDQLGWDETQRLIDRSHEAKPSTDW